MSSHRLFKLNTPPGWGTNLDLLSGRFVTCDEPPFGLTWEDLMEDLVFVSSDSRRRGIDLGWYPDRSPEGHFLIQVVDLADLTATYAKPIREFQTKSVWEAKRKMEELMEVLQRPDAEPAAESNGGPATSRGSSGVTEGPPSVS